MAGTSTVARAAEPVFDWTDAGRFAEAISSARKALFGPVQGIRQKYGLGPRGVWIIGLIESGRVRFQSDVTRLWRIGRSMVTEEVALLTKAGLVTTAPDEGDRRQLRLSLTEQGREVNDELGMAFSSRLNERLAGYRPEDIELCIALLCDLAGSARPREFIAPPGDRRG